MGDISIVNIFIMIKRLLLLERRSKYIIKKIGIYHLRHRIVKLLIDDEVIFLDYMRAKFNINNPSTKSLGRKLVVNTSRNNKTYVHNKESRVII